MRIEANGPLQSISAANRFVMERNRAALESLLQRQVKVEGHTDLAVNGLKCSGNSQRRRRHFLLFHGTFLLNFNTALVEALLLSPSKQPDYRQHRRHTDFLTNLAVPATTIKATLAQTWKATGPLAEIPRAQIETLAREKYATHAWSSRRFTSSTQRGCSRWCRMTGLFSIA
jgi:lipoate-protein ligase A